MVSNPFDFCFDCLLTKPAISKLSLHPPVLRPEDAIFCRVTDAALEIQILQRICCMGTESVLWVLRPYTHIVNLSLGAFKPVSRPVQYMKISS